MNQDKILNNLFDFQRFEGEESLEKLIKETEGRRRNTLRMIDDDELGLVVGGRDLPLEQYTVKEGETLSSIAARYGITVQTLTEINNVNESDVRPGFVLVVPVSI